MTTGFRQNLPNGFFRSNIVLLLAFFVAMVAVLIGLHFLFSKFKANRIRYDMDQWQRNNKAYIHCSAFTELCILRVVITAILILYKRKRTKRYYYVILL